MLKYDADAVARARETKEDITEDGIETAFDVRVFLRILDYSYRVCLEVGHTFCYSNEMIVFGSLWK